MVVNCVGGCWYTHVAGTLSPVPPGISSSRAFCGSFGFSGCTRAFPAGRERVHWGFRRTRKPAERCRAFGTLKFSANAFDRSSTARTGQTGKRIFFSPIIKSMRSAQLMPFQFFESICTLIFEKTEKGFSKVRIRIRVWIFRRNMRKERCVVSFIPTTDAISRHPCI